MSLFLVEHESDALADTRSPTADRQSSELEAQAESLEQQAAELRESAERLFEKAHHLRAMARRLRGDLTSNASRLDDCADLRRARGAYRRALPGLTPRQREIARLVASGRTNRQIAQELVITAGTAANHVAHVLGRLRLENRVQLAAWALEHQELWHN